MRTICDVCESAPAVLFCAADEAALCRSCDEKFADFMCSSADWVWANGLSLEVKEKATVLLNSRTIMLKLHRRLSGSTTDTNSCFSKICNLDKFAPLMQGCADLRSLKKLHARVFTHGLSWNVILGSKIVSYYANLGSLPESRLAFQTILNDDRSLWNSAMVNYYRAGYTEEVILLYKRLKVNQIGLDGKTITFGLKSCTELKNQYLGKAMHVDSLKLGLSVDKFVGSSLIGLYSKLGRMDNSQKVFKEIISKDVVAYTSMITGYSEIVDSTAWNAFVIATDMLQNNLEVNRVTLVSLLQIAGNLGALKEGKSIHCYSIRRAIGFSDDILETSTVNMYTRCEAYQSATALLQNSKGTVASWNAMLSGLTRAGQSFNAVQCLFVMLHENKVTPDSVTFANMLSACAELRYFGYAASIHAYFIRRYIPMDVVLATALIDVYSKCTRIMLSRHLFDQLIVKDVVSYNTMMYGYLQNAMANEAISLLNCMMAEGIAPDFATVLSLLAAFADQRDLIRGRWIHGFAIRHGFCSELDVKNHILHMYSVCGIIVAAWAIFDSLEKKNLVSWTAMMKGCLSRGHVDEVVQLFQLMQKCEEKLDSVILITAIQAVSDLGHLKVISAYAMHGYYNDVLEMFKKMGEKNIQPDGSTFSSVLTACSHAEFTETHSLRMLLAKSSLSMDHRTQSKIAKDCMCS
ncbi:hypothetical protein GUJ93_ZPchr0009g1950 [Zizania palustris]|uniref:B box-type domain-containing protein n=1 Tax=Zizania palustris TaxID=103762 RepID=A0A8J5RPR8_ZIZPA|nr:hypothetical protein GUJ93_ZPchr0009g1950 [Zizania palustris]